MIKNLSKKFLLIFSILAVAIFTVSSCYATPTSSTSRVESTPYSIEDIKNSDIYKRYATEHVAWSNHLKNDCYFFIYSNADGTKDNIYIYQVKDGTEYIRSHPSNSKYLSLYNSSGIASNPAYLYIYYNYSTSSFEGTYNDNTSMSANTGSFENYSNFVLRDITTIKVVNAYGINFEPITAHVDVTHQFNANGSVTINFDYSSYGTDYVLKYSLAGIEPSLDLTAPITLKNPVIYHPGITNLKVSENTKIYWVLYDTAGNSVETDVYTVPAYTPNVSDKQIIYNLSYSSDYKKATINASIENGLFSDKLCYSNFNAINSVTGTLDYGYQVFNGTLEVNTNGKIYLYAIDTFGNVFDLDVVNVTEIFNFTEADFSYEIEDKSSLHGGYVLKITPRIKNWGSKVTIKYNIKLKSGHSLAYISFDSNSDKSYCDNHFGEIDLDNKITTFTGGIASGGTLIINSQDNQLADLIGNITFTVFKDGTNVTLFNKTYDFKINSFSPDNITDGSSGGMSGTLPGNSSNSGGGFMDFNGEDPYSVFNLESNFWTFIKDALNCFPGWITSPIFWFLSMLAVAGILKKVFG